MDAVARKTWDKRHTDFLADAALGVESERAGQFLLEYLETPSTGSVSVGALCGPCGPICSGEDARSTHPSCVLAPPSGTRASQVV